MDKRLDLHNLPSWTVCGFPSGRGVLALLTDEDPMEEENLSVTAESRYIITTQR